MSTDPKRSALKTRALKSCFRILALRARSTAEIMAHLRKKDCPEEIALEIVRELTRDRILDDRDLAAQHVAGRSRTAPRSGYALAFELKKRGIDEDVIRDALQDTDDRREALAAVRMKLHQWNRLSRDHLTKKILGLLRTRGFGYEVARETLDAVLSETDDTDARSTS